MVNSTVPSLYGPLTVSKDKDSFKFMLPNLQFDDSDLVIKLGRQPEDWLLIHAEVLRSTCPLLAPGISETWNNTSSAPENIEHPGTGAQVAVRTKVLKLVDGTYVLEGKDVFDDDDEDESADLFPASSLAPPGWDTIDVYHHDTLRLKRRALIILISLLYGAHLDCRSIADVSEGRQINTICMDLIFLSEAVTVCPIAKFWGCLDVIKPCILSILKSSMGYWEIVAMSPEKHMALATKLEDEEIYRDALRHIIAEAHSADDWEEVASVMGSTEVGLRDFYKPQFEALGPKVQELREELQTLQLVYMRVKYWGGSWYEAPMRYIDTIPHKEARKGPSKVHFLAGGIYSEWLTSQISGEKFIDGDSMGMVEKAGSLSLAINKIIQAAKSRCPAGLFDAATAVYVARDFNLSFSETRQLEQHLHLLVHKAGLRVEAAFPLVEEWDNVPAFGIHVAEESNLDAGADQADINPDEEDESWKKGLVHFITERAHYDAHRHGYTYLKIPADLPWDAAGPVALAPAGNNGVVTGISVADATAEWILALEEHYGTSG